MEFIRGYDEFLARAKPRLSDAKALLDLADRAIRARQSPG